MRKNFMRLLSCAVAALMTFALAVPAFAETAGGHSSSDSSVISTEGSSITVSSDGASNDDPSAGDSSGINFDNGVTPEGSPDGTGTNESQDNNLVATTRENGAVAKIDDVEYNTLDEAIEKASDGAIIELMSDAKLSSTTFKKTLVIDGADHRIDAANAYLNIAGNVTFKNCSMDFSGTPNGHWMYFYMASNGKLTFDGADVTVDGADAANNTTVMYFPEPNTPSASVSFNNTTFTAKNCKGNGISWGGWTNNGNNKLDIVNSSVTIENCAGENAGGGGGIIGTFDITVKNSKLNSLNNRSYGSNGSNFYVDNSILNFNGNGTHGLSSTDLTIENGSTVTADDNGYYGIYVTDAFLVDGTSTLNVTHNSSKEDCAGLKLKSGVKDGQVEKGAVVNITDNFCSGLSNNGKVTFEEGAKLTITGNTNDKGSSSYGAGIYNSGSSAKLTLPSDAVIYNNHTVTAGDDIYNNSTATITFGQTGSDWKLDGNNKEITASNDCTDAIDGWYDDTANARWSAHADDYSGVHVESYALDGSIKTVTGPLALKAAHGLGTVAVDPADITIYMGGDEGYQGVVNGSDQVTESNSLPEPGFYFTLPVDVNNAFKEAGVTTEGELANLSQYMKIYTKDGSRNWKIEKYGEDYSGAYDKYIYRIISEDSNTNPARLTFTSKDGSQIFTSDNFNPADIGALDQQYNMQLYTGLVDNNQIVFETDIPSADGSGSEKHYSTMKLETGILTIRYVTGNQDDVVTDVVASEDKLAEAKTENPDKAFALASDDMKYFINGSKIDVSDTAAPSLLFDDVVSDHNTNGAGAYDQQLANRALDVISSDGTELTNPWYQAKYLDLVDANNGNVWLTPENPVTIYWPYPEGTDENTEFHLVHFKGLDREISNDQITNEIDSSQAESVDIENTEYGIRFETDSFSPFVLTWDAGTEAGEQPEPTTKINESDANNVLPQTGDTTNWILPLVIACIAALVAVGAYRMSRRNR